jgi:putative transposase
MANTYSKSYFQIVFAVKFRQSLISRNWKEELYKYITGIIQAHGHKLLAVGGMPDHIHIFIGYNLNHLIPHLVEEIKTSTNAWINRQKLCPDGFAWQKGYGAFTYSWRQIDTIINYIMTQEEHHKSKSFKDEYVDLLIQNSIEYDQNYLFEFFNDVAFWI